jgi:peptidoglycan glycosyltransferase
VQVVRGDAYANDSRNSRVLLRTYEQERGPISVLTGGSSTPIATSTDTGGRLRYLRTYADGPTYAHVTGFVSLVYGTPQGVERAEDRLLTGDDDRLFTRRISDFVTGREPSGGSAVLTIDAAAQQAAVAGLGSNRGAVVALDPRTGAVLAMASAPTFDPSRLSSHDPADVRAYYDQLTNDPAQPLLNRAIASTYPPGLDVQGRHGRPRARDRHHPRTRRSRRRRSSTCRRRAARPAHSAGPPAAGETSTLAGSACGSRETPRSARSG